MHKGQHTRLRNQPIGPSSSSCLSSSARNRHPRFPRAHLGQQRAQERPQRVVEGGGGVDQHNTVHQGGAGCSASTQNNTGSGGRWRPATGVSQAAALQCQFAAAGEQRWPTQSQMSNSLCSGSQRWQRGTCARTGHARLLSPAPTCRHCQRQQAAERLAQQVDGARG